MPDEPIALEQMGPLLEELDRGIEALRRSIEAALLQPAVEPAPAVVDRMNWILSQLQTDGRRLVAVGERLATIPLTTPGRTAAVGSIESLTYRVDQLIDRHSEVAAAISHAGVESSVEALEAATAAVTEMVGHLEARVAEMPGGNGIIPGERPVAFYERRPYFPGLRMPYKLLGEKAKTREGMVASISGGLYGLSLLLGAAWR